MSFLSELRRRNVIRMAGLYLVGAWLVVQVAATLLPVFEAPAWVMKSLVGLLAIGFVVAMVISWAYQLTTSGLRRESDIDAGNEPYQGPDRRAPRLRRISELPAGAMPTPRTYRRLQDRLIIALLVIALGYFLVDKWLLRQSPAVPLTNETATEPATQEKSEGGLVAVLPFRNRSAKKEDAYFAEGMHDDLLTQLAKVPGLKVVSRTSMMRFADTKLSIPEIGRELGAAVVLEGAVQRAGDQVLITVQLIDAKRDVHLWAERYDRVLNMSNVFAIQSEIAKAVADATSVALSPDQSKEIAEGSTRNLLAYEAFLQGKLLAALDRATPERFAAALEQFDRAIALDGKFAHAMARKARTQLASYWFGYSDVSMRDAGIRTTEQVTALAPNDIETWMAQAYERYWGELDYAAADALLAKVLKAVPGQPEAWYARGLVARRDGRFDDSISAFRHSLENDPANTDTLIELSNTLLTLGEYKESDALRERVKALGGEMPTHTAEDQFNRGNIEAAWAALDGPNDFYVTLPFRIALASRKPEWIAKSLSPDLWPKRLQEFPEYPDAYEMAQAEALLVEGKHEQAMVALHALKKKIEARPKPYPGAWSSTGFYFYYPCDLPGMLGDLEGVRAAEQDWIKNAPRDAWAENGARFALAVAFARSGDPERALTHLEAIAARIGPVSFIGFSLTPGLDSLHEQPRYKALEVIYEQWRQRHQ